MNGFASHKTVDMNGFASHKTVDMNGWIASHKPVNINVLGGLDYDTGGQAICDYMKCV